MILVVRSGLESGSERGWFIEEESRRREKHYYFSAVFSFQWLRRLYT